MDDQARLEKALNLRKRDLSEKDFTRFEGYVEEIFNAFGMDTKTASTIDTPKRFIKALYDITEGYEGDPKLVKAFESECRSVSGCKNNQIIQGPIQFYSLCEHHALPFFGNAYVGYIANDDIIGISKLTRLVRVFSKRFAVQERIGQEVANMLEEMVNPEGVAVYIEARHLCMEMRGAKENSPLTRTTVFRGKYEEDANLREEFLRMCGK